MASAHYGSLYIPFVYTNSVGFGIAYPWEAGNARASERGMSNSSDTRASFFGVFQSVTIQIKMNLAFWVSRRKKERFLL